jgi:phosphoribosylanthranilate isomerase
MNQGLAVGKRVAVKICGVCSVADAALAAAAGAAYVGVILAPGRSRSRSLSEAAAIFQGTDSAGAGSSGAVRRVGVFVDASASDMLAAAELLHLDVLQLHGNENAALARAAGGGAPATVAGSVRPAAAAAAAAAVRTPQVWKAVPVRTSADVEQAVAEYEGSVHGLLLEGWSPDGSGGVGAAFDRVAVAAVRDRVPPGLAVIVAGGLTAENVGEMVTLLRPDVVDVSSGVEAALCRKSAERVRAFIAAARHAGEHG